MNFRLLVFYISAAIALSLASLSYFYVQKWHQALLILFVSMVISFILLTNILHHHIHNRISNIYKLIRSLKLGKDMKVVLAEHASEDPILSTEKEVREWAIQKSSEIDQLKAQEKFRREFLSNISHEFKTPLFAIQGYIETLKDGMMEDDIDMATNFLNKASKNIDRLTYLINDLDEISKLETGQISIHIEKFDIVELILETVDHLIDKAKKQNIEIIVDLKNTHPVFVKADRQRIQQVIINLIDNSIKYGKEGGKTKINIYPLLDQILIEVTDNGQGIEEKNLTRVFERFFRTDKSRSREIGGSGLGLSIVKHIIEAHQQTVHARSTEGIGTTFGFTLEKAKSAL
ncbi:sensor histidine kinase [Sphingobacterium sp. SGL-16]|uniref:sensor histidine kinase n=1 Tax=Sphingobacterium sp. SGL-16 TaxID=2710883 RepID=UPI0013ECEC73|nr:ATP-binding protein [Sphingobacterium sp. SGL-16]NGM73566.1 sensor histidine kinase [Sphingobacterium sp. SGL-16]